MPIFLLFGEIPSYLSFLGQNWFEHPSSWGSPSAQVIWLLGYLVEIFMQRPLLSSYPCSSYWVIWLFGKNLMSYPCPSYWVIWLFGRNFYAKTAPYCYPCPSYWVIWLFGYLVKILCENSSSLAIPVQVIGLFGYLAKILCGDSSSTATAISIQVIWLFGYLVHKWVVRFPNHYFW